MSVKPSKPVKSASNKPFFFPTRLTSPRTSTSSHHSSNSETGSTASKHSSRSSNSKKHRGSHSSLTLKITSSEHRDSSPSASSTSSCAASSTLLGTSISPEMAQNSSKRTDRSNAYRLSTDKPTDTKPFILHEVDEGSDHGPLSEPKLSLFNAARELQRRNITVKGLSIHHLPSTSSPPTRDNRAPNLARNDNPSFPEYLLAMPSDPSPLDIALRTVLNAGATVDFHATPYGASSPHNGFYQCVECGDKFGSEADYEEHTSWDDRYCTYCRVRFDCRGKLEEHHCATRVRGGRKMT